MPTIPSKGLEIGQLVRWNTYLSRIKVNDKPLIPFANQIAFLRCEEAEVLYGGGTRGGNVSRHNLVHLKIRGSSNGGIAVHGLSGL